MVRSVKILYGEQQGLEALLLENLEEGRIADSTVYGGYTAA